MPERKSPILMRMLRTSPLDEVQSLVVPLLPVKVEDPTCHSLEILETDDRRCLVRAWWVSYSTLANRISDASYDGVSERWTRIGRRQSNTSGSPYVARPECSESPSVDRRATRLDAGASEARNVSISATVMIRRRVLSMSVLVLVLAACTLDFSPPFLPACGDHDDDRELTGDLAEDLAGGWFDDGGSRDDAHPMLDLPPLGEGQRVWLFREDGTGTVWYEASAPEGDIEEEASFTWTTEDGRLVVDDFPPAELEWVSDGRFRVLPPDDIEGGGPQVLSRCEIEG